METYKGYEYGEGGGYLPIPNFCDNCRTIIPANQNFCTSICAVEYQYRMAQDYGKEEVNG